MKAKAERIGEWAKTSLKSRSMSGKMLFVFALMIQLVPVLVWVERRGFALIQNRYGPNRVGPLGLLQLLADAVKFLFKEEFLPAKGVRLLYYGAPVVALVPGALALGAIPLGPPIDVAASPGLVANGALIRS